MDFVIPRYLATPFYFPARPKRLRNPPRFFGFLGVSRANLVASSKMHLTPSFVRAVASKYLAAPIFCATDCPCPPGQNTYNKDTLFRNRVLLVDTSVGVPGTYLFIGNGPLPPLLQLLDALGIISELSPKSDEDYRYGRAMVPDLVNPLAYGECVT